MIPLSETPSLTYLFEKEGLEIELEVHVSKHCQKLKYLPLTLAGLMQKLPLYWGSFLPLLPNTVSKKPHWLKKHQGKVHLAVTLITNPEIKKINAQYRSKNEPTDVLSFPIMEEFLSYGLPLSQLGEQLDLGDIYISLPFIWDENSRNYTIKTAEFNHAYNNSVFERFCHGCLHLLGVHHDTMKDYNQVKSIQTKVLNTLNS